MTCLRCADARSRLRLDGAELDGAEIRWCFRIDDAASSGVTYVHATSSELAAGSGPLHRVFHTDVAGLSVHDLVDVAADVRIGLPAGVTLEQLENRIGEELARQMLSLSFALEMIDMREAADTTRHRRLRRRSAA